MGTTVFSVDATKIYHFKVKDFGIKKDPLCLGNISWNASTNIMKKKRRIKWMCIQFLCHDKTFETSAIFNIHKKLMKKHDIK